MICLSAVASRSLRTSLNLDHHTICLKSSSQLCFWLGQPTKSFFVGFWTCSCFCRHISESVFGCFLLMFQQLLCFGRSHVRAFKLFPSVIPTLGGCHDRQNICKWMNEMKWSEMERNGWTWMNEWMKEGINEWMNEQMNW